MRSQEVRLGRVYKVVENLGVEEEGSRMTQCTEPWRIRRWHVIRCALAHPNPAAQSALEGGLARQPVQNLAAAYNRQGPQAAETPGHGQRQRASLSLARERAVVSKSLRQRARGRVSTGNQIKPGLERASGQRAPKATAYRILRRQQGREVVPRPRPPQASAEEHAAFKRGFP